MEAWVPSGGSGIRWTSADGLWRVDLDSLEDGARLRIERTSPLP